MKSLALSVLVKITLVLECVSDLWIYQAMSWFCNISVTYMRSLVSSSVEGVLIIGSANLSADNIHVLILPYQ